ncbi:MAG TPA: hypothetical protein VD963_05750 [Phycisphaerales bacterium]|nr:hypothetical protein [Phycisphaerales bacterium]
MTAPQAPATRRHPVLATMLWWSVPALALLAVGPVAGWLAGMIAAADGGPATPLASARPLLGLGLLLAIWLLALATGCLAAGVLGPGAGLAGGLFATGLVLVWAAATTGSIDQVLRSVRSPGVFRVLALEGLVIAALMAGAAVLVGRTARPRPDPATVPARAWLLAPSTLLGLGMATAAAAAIILAVAAEPAKGQCLAAAALAGIASGLVGRLAAPAAPAAAWFLPLGLLAALGPLTALIVPAGAGGPVAAAISGRLFKLALPLPLDVAAGAFLGVPIGLSWADSMLGRAEQQLREPAPSARASDR